MFAKGDTECLGVTVIMLLHVGTHAEYMITYDMHQ